MPLKASTVLWGCVRSPHLYGRSSSGPLSAGKAKPHRHRSGGVHELLKRLERPTQVEDWLQLVHRLPLRPAPGAGKRAGSTGIWGELRDAAGQPIPFALVQVQTRFR